MGDYKFSEMFNNKLYKTPYHSAELSGLSFLITGGAGFIGSNLVEYLLKFGAGHVRVLDNLSNGYFENIKEFLSLPNFEFIEGDIRDLETCKKSLENIDFVLHQAALGSVPRSIEDPIKTNSVNIDGFLNVLEAVRSVSREIRIVYAASSSSYGDSDALPKVEGIEGRPLSPYAVTKLVNELYAELFSKVYGLHTIGLRYFNVFGPKQNPNNPYAAVIPIFCKSFLVGERPTIFGDGKTSRDFTFIENVVQANIIALFAKDIEKHEIFNVACGDQISLNDTITLLKKVSGKDIQVNYKPNRKGDIMHSKASIEKIKKMLGYKPLYNFETGLQIVYNWYKEQAIL